MPPKCALLPQNRSFNHISLSFSLTKLIYPLLSKNVTSRIFALLLAKFAKVPGLGGGGQLAGTGKRQQAQELKEKKRLLLCFFSKNIPLRQSTSSNVNLFACWSTWISPGCSCSIATIASLAWSDICMFSSNRKTVICNNAVANNIECWHKKGSQRPLLKSQGRKRKAHLNSFLEDLLNLIPSPGYVESFTNAGFLNMFASVIQMWI